MKATDCARQVLDVVPLVVRSIRSEMRRHRGADLSVPQLRALAFLSREAGASLSQVATHVGTTLPSMSKMVDGLVARGLVRRETSAQDRRRVTLTLSARGQDTLRASRARTQARFAEILAGLSVRDRAGVGRSMEALRRVFEAPPGPAAGDR